MQTITEIKLLEEPITEKIAQIICNIIKKEGVTHIFGINGGYTVGIGEELHNHPEIQFIHTQHEQGAAFMADGYAKVSGKFGVIVVSAGPGLSNTLTGILSAKADGVPVLLLSGEVPIIKSAKGAIQDTSSFGASIMSIFKEATKYAVDIPVKEIFLQHFRTGIRHLFKGKKGPVFFNIASDLFSQEIEHNFEYTQHTDNRVFEADSVKYALEILKESKSAVIFAGHGVCLGQAQQQLENLAEILGVPVIVSPMGKSAINHESQYFLGSFGASSNIIPELYLKNEGVDTMIAVGTSYNEFSSNAWNEVIPKAKTLIQVDIDPYVIGRSFANTFGVMGDAASTMRYMIRKIKEEKCDFLHLNKSDRIEYYKQNFNNFAKPEQYNSEETPIVIPRLYRDIFESFYDNKVNIFSDIGSVVFWSNHYMKLRKGWNFYTSLGFSSMGYAFSAAIGGACALDDWENRVTIAIAGDGAAIMNGNELKTASEYNIPVFFFVLNDGMLGIVHQSTKIICGRPNVGTAFNTPIDFKHFAESLGVEAYTITEPGQLNKNFIQSLIAKNKPILFDCKVKVEVGPYGDRIKQVTK